MFDIFDIADIAIEEIGDKSLLIVFELISVILGIIVSSIDLKNSTDKPLSNKHKSLFGNLFLWIGIVGLIFVFVKAIYTAFTYSSYSNQWINTETADIPDDAVSFKGHSYYLFDSVASSWSDVIQFSSDRGGYPVVINNKKENDFLFNYMKGLGKKRAFIGYTDKEKEDTWQWVYGMDSKFEGWGVNSRGQQQPNKESEEEDWACLDTKTQNGHWNDKEFGRGGYAFICEWDSVK